MGASSKFLTVFLSTPASFIFPTVVKMDERSPLRPCTSMRAFHTFVSGAHMEHIIGKNSENTSERLGPLKSIARVLLSLPEVAFSVEQDGGEQWIYEACYLPAHTFSSHKRAKQHALEFFNGYVELPKKLIRPDKRCERNTVRWNACAHHRLVHLNRSLTIPTQEVGVHHNCICDRLQLKSILRPEKDTGPKKTREKSEFSLALRNRLSRRTNSSR